MTETYSITIGKKDLYSKNYKSFKTTNIDHKNKVNISKSLIDIFSILIKEEK
ncbi:TPA: hypothetical protein KQF34_003067 [Clostridioides difficile]|nr:hypothetical protein [Clostridioides difficile]